MKTIWGNELANEVKDTIRSEVDQIKAEGKRLPVLAVVLVGDNPASQSYVQSKANACINVGMENRTITLDGNISQEELLDTVKKLNADEKVDGILVQLPLPKHLDAVSVIMAIKRCGWTSSRQCRKSIDRSTWICTMYPKRYYVYAEVSWPRKFSRKTSCGLWPFQFGGKTGCVIAAKSKRDRNHRSFQNTGY